ncbi:hypothetical protein [Nocardiopsis sp. LOL_012]|uniref:hypothetical protein n=1 Tax=Nocardiopsis sp. LOL_012 TaxID=3345409 RepID=UPI003A83D3F5
MLRRAGAASLTVVVVMLGTVSSANADTAGSPSFLGQIECGSSGGDGCSILLQWWNHHSGTPGSEGGSGSTGGGGTGAVDPDDPYADVDWDAVDWDSVDWDAVDWDAIDWDAVFAEEDAATPGTDPVTLIQESMDSFELPEPVIATSPAEGSLVLVHTPLWLWIDEQTWAPATASAAVPGWSLELTATPAQTTWTMGEGTEIVCDGPGTPYDPAAHAPDSASPDCGHIYTVSSGAQEGGAYTVTAAVTWDVAWEFSDGASGTLDTAATAAQITVEVEESQSLVSESGR